MTHKILITLSLIGKQNQLFTENELGIIRQCRLAAEERLQHVRTNRTEMKDKQEQLVRQAEAPEFELSVLESEEYYLINKIESYSAALSPHNKLPPEILRHIFKCCIHEKQVDEIPATYRGGAYTISRVCSAWRRIALDTPELWTGISLQLTKENEKRILVARQWLSRARTLPRSISIKQNSLLECDEWGNNIILNLVAHYPLRSLELTLTHKQLKQLEGLLDQSIPTLEVLQLKCCSGNGLLPLPFCPADTLSKLNMLVLEGNWDLQNLTAVGSWSRIVHLDIKPEISAPQCFVILQQCSQIEFCNLYVQSIDAEPVSTIPDIILPQIQSLRVHTGGITTKLLVDAVTAPKLINLVFLRRSQSQAPINVDSATFCQMIERCQGLKHLTTFRVGPTSEPLNPLTLLEKLPHLEMLQISNGILDEGAINRISLGKVGAKLKKMIFKSTHDANEILRMVEVRRQNANLNSYGPLARVSPFTEVTFNCVSVSSSLNEELISRKNALENSCGKITINLTFNQ